MPYRVYHASFRVARVMGNPSPVVELVVTRFRYMGDVFNCGRRICTLFIYIRASRCQTENHKHIMNMYKMSVHAVNEGSLRKAVVGVMCVLLLYIYCM